MDLLVKYSQLLSKYKLPSELKDCQKDIIGQLVRRQDVIGVLPTGFGKSLCYISTPLIMDLVS